VLDPFSGEQPLRKTEELPPRFSRLFPWIDHKRPALGEM
jgi:hypothetical protein